MKRQIFAEDNKIACLADLQDEMLVQYFDKMQEFQNKFLDKEQYWRYPYPWPRDALNQWSRQWEYPYSLHQLLELGKCKVLDAGSGMTFYPFFLDSLGYKVHCVDKDYSLSKNFKYVLLEEKNEVEFLAAELKRLPYINSEFDAINCISVLEHTYDREAIIREFHRILKNDGLLILTFDLSLDGQGEVYLPNLPVMLKTMKDYFNPEYPLNLSFTEDIITTDYYMEHSPNKVALGNPSYWHKWKRSIVKKFYKRLSDYPRLAVVGLTMRKKG